MDVLKATRELGKALQADERFVEYAKYKLDLDKDEEVFGKNGFVLRDGLLGKLPGKQGSANVCKPCGIFRCTRCGCYQSRRGLLYDQYYYAHDAGSTDYAFKGLGELGNRKLLVRYHR